MTTQEKVMEKVEGNPFATSGMILGIIGIALNFIPVVPYVLGVLAIIFGVVGGKKEVKKKVAKASLILGIVTIGLKLLFWLGLFSFGGF